MEQFEDYLQDDDTEIASAAEILTAAKDGYENGELTKEQFDELAQDAMQIGEMQEIANNLDRKIKIQKVFGIFKTILRTIR